MMVYHRTPPPPPKRKTGTLERMDIDQIYVVNLERRTDRREHAEKELNSIGLKNYEFFKAIDAAERGLKPDNINFTPGMLGCFLSHRCIWAHALEQGYSRICIFEDDMRFIPKFNQYLELAWLHLPKDWQLAYLGFTEYRKFRAPSDVRKYLEQRAVNGWWVVPENGWGTQCYLLNGRDTIRQVYDAHKEMKEQVDGQMLKAAQDLKLKHYSIFPTAVLQSGLQTDVQHAKK